MKKAFIIKSLIASIGLSISSILFAPTQADAQIVNKVLPSPWVSVGSQEGDVTFSVGAKVMNFGVELGKGPDSSVGVDVLQFLNLPVVEPYVGVGYYTDDKGFAYSGGVQVNASKNVFIGAGYNSVRGINGQLGVKF
ncbi:MAG: hypothetical protein AAF378_19070 [Cyanobacteria bacterium P01_A01_bin.84]